MMFQTEICTDVQLKTFSNVLIEEVIADVKLKLTLVNDYTFGRCYTEIDEIEGIEFIDDNFDDLSEEYGIDKNILIPILIASIVNQLDDGRIDILDDVVDSARVAYYDDLAGRIFNDY